MEHILDRGGALEFIDDLQGVRVLTALGDGRQIEA
jgi:hypothetical protein